MREASKAYRRRKNDPFWSEVFQGAGIDIGSGSDPFRQEWFPKVSSIKTFDLIDGDAQFISKHVKDSFDFVHSSNCLEHMNDARLAIKEWWKLVRPGGHMVFTVPDEDLYEQGIWPSQWNDDHKCTFTIWKEKSWSPVSISLIEIIRLLENCQVLRMQVVDNGFDYNVGIFDQTSLGAEACIEVVLKNTSAKEFIPRTFKHSGARGDIIYSLPTIQALGGGQLLLVRESGAYIGKAMTLQELEWMRELLVGECGITEVIEWDKQQVQFNLDKFRSQNLMSGSLTEAHASAFRTTIDSTKPWIHRERFEPKHIAEIIVNRSSRYAGPLCWQELKEWEGDIAFLGFEDEWKAFRNMTGMRMSLYTPSSYVDICRVLAGSKLFIGNQSFIYSLAEAMKVNRVQEAYLCAPNCLPQGGKGSIALTSELIRHCVCSEGERPNLPTKVHSLFSLRNKVTGSITSKRLKMNSIVPYQPLVSIILVSKDAIWLEEIQKSLKTMPLSEIIQVNPEDGMDGINLEAMRSQGLFVCIIEEGTKLYGTWFWEMVGMMTSNNVGAVGTALIPAPIPHIERGIMLTTRRALEECGLFDSRAENPWLDFSMRLHKYGYTQRQARSTSVIVRAK